jgi:hypothetical protein
MALPVLGPPPPLAADLSNTGIEKTPMSTFSRSEVISFQDITIMLPDSGATSCPSTCTDKSWTKLDSKFATHDAEKVYDLGQKARSCPACPKLHPLMGKFNDGSVCGQQGTVDLDRHDR